MTAKSTRSATTKTKKKHQAESADGESLHPEAALISLAMHFWPAPESCVSEQNEWLSNTYNLSTHQPAMKFLARMLGSAMHTCGRKAAPRMSFFTQIPCKTEGASEGPKCDVGGHVHTGVGAAGAVGQVTSSNVAAGGAAAAATAAAQPADSSSTVGSASVINSGPQTAAQVPLPPL